MVPAWLNWAEEHWNKWAIRLAAGSSLAMHIVVLVLADVRRDNSAWPGWTLFLWLAYQIMNMAGSFALGNLSLNDTGDKAAGEKEQLLVAFWAPFLLLHLGGPDNIGAYSLDDDKLGWRKVVVAIPTIAAALHILLTKIWLADDGGLLRPASVAMFVVGLVRFAGNVWAMIRALRTKKQQETEILDDSSARALSGLDELWNEVIKYTNKIYENLYTKAGVVHSGIGYILRLLSPLATTTAFILFCLYPKGSLQAADVIITYILMLAALVLDVGWLVAALASESAKEFLEANPGIWFRHQILCNGWWQSLHDLSLLLRPGRLLVRGPTPSTYGYGSDFIGRYNLLLVCARAPPGWIARQCNRLESIFRQDDAGWSDYRAWKSSSELKRYVKEVLLERIKERLEQSRATNNARSYSREDIRTRWGQVAVQKRKDIFDVKKLDFFGSAFQEDILLWHIATTIYLCSNNNNHAEMTMRWRVKAIEAVSEYLMFLLAARPHMLPDPPLRSLYEVTRKALQDLYNEDKANDDDLCCASKKKKLVNKILLRRPKEQQSSDDDDRNRSLIWYAAELASQLQNLDASRSQDVLDLVFDVWVDKLLYAGINCNRDSHARQLGKGGELVTITWIAAEYAAVVFQIGETGNRRTKNLGGGNGGGGGGGGGGNGGGGDGPGPCPINGTTKPPKCHCHEDPLEPVCPHTCCVQDYYCCTQDYHYC